MSENRFSRPELAVFFDMMARAGGTLPRKPWVDDVSYDLETSATDAVQIDLQDDDTLNLAVFFSPEDSFADLSSPQMAAVIAKWLRDVAARLDVAAAGTLIPASFFEHTARIEAVRRHGEAPTESQVAAILAEVMA